MELTGQKYKIAPLETLYVGGGITLLPATNGAIIDGIHQCRVPDDGVLSGRRREPSQYKSDLLKGSSIQKAIKIGNAMDLENEY